MIRPFGHTETQVKIENGEPEIRMPKAVVFVYKSSYNKYMDWIFALIQTLAFGTFFSGKKQRRELNEWRKIQKNRQ